MTDQTDVVVRGLTDEDAFRVIAAITTHTAQQVVSLQHVRDHDAEMLSDVITGTMMIRETMAPDLRVQTVLKSADGKVSLVGDAHPDGTNRGLVTRAGEKGASPLGDGALLQVMRTLPNGSIHQGIVRLSQDDDLSSAFMSYMHESEQIKTNIAVGSVASGEKVLVAGGYFVQLLPGLSDADLAIMIAHLENIPPIKRLLSDEQTTAKTMMSRLLHGLPFHFTSESPVRFGCYCNHDRVLAGLATLKPTDLRDMIAEGKPLSIECDYCGAEYEVTVTDLEGILTSN